MEELLPAGVPSDWVAVGGVDLFSEYERKVEEVAAKLGIDPPPDPAVARRQVEAVCVTAEPSFDPADVPALTTDPDDDLIVWTALSAGADLLISDDRARALDGHEDGRRLLRGRYERGETTPCCACARDARSRLHHASWALKQGSDVAAGRAAGDEVDERLTDHRDQGCGRACAHSAPPAISMLLPVR
jgi:hypothetical protein